MVFNGQKIMQVTTSVDRQIRNPGTTARTTTKLPTPAIWRYQWSGFVADAQLTDEGKQPSTPIFKPTHDSKKKRRNVNSKSHEQQIPRRRGAEKLIRGPQ